MRVRRLVATGAMVLMAAAGAGCSATADGSPAPRPEVVVPSDPVAAFALAKSQLGSESARFSQDAGSDLLDFTGIVDTRTGNWELTGKEYVVRRVGTDVYIRASGKTLESMTLVMAPAAADRLAAGGWVRTRLPNGRELAVVFNDEFPWNLANPATRATDVIRTGDGAFSGKVPGKDSKDLRLDVNLDDRARFTRIHLGPGTTFTFSDFGVRADIGAPPPGEVVEEENPSFTSGLGLY